MESLFVKTLLAVSKTIYYMNFNFNISTIYLVLDWYFQRSKNFDYPSMAFKSLEILHFYPYKIIYTIDKKRMVLK